MLLINYMNNFPRKGVLYFIYRSCSRYNNITVSVECFSLLAWGKMQNVFVYWQIAFLSPLRKRNINLFVLHWCHDLILRIQLSIPRIPPNMIYKWNLQNLNFFPFGQYINASISQYILSIHVYDATWVNNFDIYIDYHTI